MSRAAIVGLALSFIPAEQAPLFRERLAELSTASPDFSTLAEEIAEQLRLSPWNQMIEGTQGELRGIGIVMHAQLTATLLSAKATEHVAERLDKIIELMFDEGRPITMKGE